MNHSQVLTCSSHEPFTGIKRHNLFNLDEYTQFTERVLSHQLLDPLGGPSAEYHIALARLKLQKSDMDEAEASLKEALQFDHQVNVNKVNSVIVDPFNSQFCRSVRNYAFDILL